MPVQTSGSTHQPGAAFDLADSSALVALFGKEFYCYLEDAIARIRPNGWL